MLQDHSLFFFPLTYFGSSLPLDEEIEEEEEEWDFAKIMQVSKETHLTFLQRQPTGLFIYWCDGGDIFN